MLLDQCRPNIAAIDRQSDTIIIRNSSAEGTTIVSAKAYRFVSLAQHRPQPVGGMICPRGNLRPRDGADSIAVASIAIDVQFRRNSVFL